ncbi:response regulator [Pelagicoccus albus]|uniref:Response regulator n=1 Tax=Pelagicoccus albus TaxID=415222 RepID=A0A7X1E7D1_9BACT|nr:response regulator [Pelagicoccus albus]MBC2604998.1 response regulator [Pelagicoccus albus]
MDLLILEDNEDDIFLIQAAIKEVSNGMEIVFARNVEEANSLLTQAIADRTLPKACLVDLRIEGGVSGFEFLENVRSNPEAKLIPLVVFSSSDYVVDIETAYRKGANSYLVKPFSFSALVELVKSFEDYWMRQNNLPPAFRGES